jgi:hypothetical protein
LLSTTVAFDRALLSSTSRALFWRLIKLIIVATFFPGMASLPFWYLPPLSQPSTPQYLMQCNWWCIRLEILLDGLWPIGRTTRPPLLRPPMFGSSSSRSITYESLSHFFEPSWTFFWMKNSLVPTCSTFWSPSNDWPTWRVCSHIAPPSSQKLGARTYIYENTLYILTYAMHIDIFKMAEVLACS